MKKRKSNKAKRPEIGVGCLVVDAAGKIMLCKRLKPYGYGKLALPGGHLEWQETLEDCARREVLEESGIKLGEILNLDHYTQEITGTRHYITFYLIAPLPYGQEAVRTEPKKHGAWKWYDPFDLPDHAWEPTKRLIRLCGEKIAGAIRVYRWEAMKAHEIRAEKITKPSGRKGVRLTIG
jgi:8-oxo-dGTP diphosphatase